MTDIFEVFAHLTHYYDLHNHPGVQAIMTIGQMVADAACEGKMNSMIITFSFWESDPTTKEKRRKVRKAPYPRETRLKFVP